MFNRKKITFTSVLLLYFKLCLTTMKIDSEIRTNFIFSTMTIEKISESVYVGMCLRIGTTQQVASRRDIADIKEMLVQNAKLKHQSKTMVSGSR